MKFAKNKGKDKRKPDSETLLFYIVFLPCCLHIYTLVNYLVNRIRFFP